MQAEGGAGPAGAQAQELRGAGTLLGAGAALGWAGLCSPRAAGVPPPPALKGCPG